MTPGLILTLSSDPPKRFPYGATNSSILYGTHHYAKLIRYQDYNDFLCSTKQQTIKIDNNEEQQTNRDERQKEGE